MVVVVSSHMRVLGSDGVVNNISDHGGGWLSVVNDIIDNFDICWSGIAATGWSAGVLDPALLAAADTGGPRSPPVLAIDLSRFHLGHSLN